MARIPIKCASGLNQRSVLEYLWGVSRMVTPPPPGDPASKIEGRLLPGCGPVTGHWSVGRGRPCLLFEGGPVPARLRRKKTTEIALNEHAERVGKCNRCVDRRQSPVISESDLEDSA